jgi:hypothetical protein
MSSSPLRVQPQTPAEEEEALRHRVRQLRLQRLAQEQLQSRVALTREGANIRAEIAKLRQKIFQTSATGTVGGVSITSPSAASASLSSGGPNLSN